MAGHSKFKNIMHRKGKQDKIRAKQFTKVGREIIVAAKLGGPDPNFNPRLRLAIQNAKAVNMPNANVDAAIKKGAGAGEAENYEEIRYEGYAPGGVALIVEALSDNRNRTAGEVRTLFNKNEGNLGETGSVGFMFDRVGEIIYPADTANDEAMFEGAVEAGAENCESSSEEHEITCAADAFASVRAALVEKFGEPERSGLVWRPNVHSPVNDVETARKVLNLIDALEDNDDVQSVTSNADVDENVMAQLEAE